MSLRQRPVQPEPIASRLSRAIAVGHAISLDSNALDAVNVGEPFASKKGKVTTWTASTPQHVANIIKERFSRDFTKFLVEGRLKDVKNYKQEFTVGTGLNMYATIGFERSDTGNSAQLKMTMEIRSRIPKDAEVHKMEVKKFGDIDVWSNITRDNMVNMVNKLIDFGTATFFNKNESVISEYSRQEALKP